MRRTLAGAREPAFGQAVVGRRRAALEKRARAVDREAIPAHEHITVHRARRRTVATDFPLEVEPDRKALSHFVGELVDADPERLETECPVLVGCLTHQLGPY